MEKRLNELSNEEAKKQITGFLAFLNKGYGNILDKEQLKLIYEELIFWISGNEITDSDLGKIYHEMAENYKKYLPLCYFSIRTAYNNIK